MKDNYEFVQELINKYNLKEEIDAERSKRKIENIPTYDVSGNWGVNKSVLMKKESEVKNQYQAVKCNGNSDKCEYCYQVLDKIENEDQKEICEKCEYFLKQQERKDDINKFSKAICECIDRINNAFYTNYNR